MMTDNFIHTTEIYNNRAAEEVVPLLIEFFDPKSVIDVGCGLGTWLKVFENYEITDVIGIDGNYIDRSLLSISFDKFIISNLEEEFRVNRTFDLLLCLEVAEHLSDDRAKGFIDNLTRLSDIIIFSAALPGQGGQNHINERYPDYWLKYFVDNGFFAVDLLRPEIWNNTKIDWWYRQNTICYIRNDSFWAQKYYRYKTDKIKIIISRELFESKIKERDELLTHLTKIKSGCLSIKFYIKILLRYLINKLQYLPKFIRGKLK